MVGVPSSKGCALCLRRSVKCDEVRPTCSQCRSGGRACPGYARPMKFVDEGPKLRRLTSRAKIRFHNRRLVEPSSNCITVPATVQGPHLMGDHSADIALPVSQYNRNQGSSSICWFSSSAQDREQLLASFISDMFPLGVVSVQKSFLGSWLWHVPTRFGANPVLDYSALTLALAYFAQTSGDKATRLDAERTYGIALKALAAAVANEHKRFGADVLCATMLLSNYESYHASHSWVRHAGGAARLMQLRGASRCYESAFEYSMYLACRGTIVSAALAASEPCFLADKEWRAIPEGLIEFPLLPRSPELHHAFFGYIAAVPGILYQMKLLEDDVLKSDHLSLLFEAKTLREGLRLWYDEYITIDDGLRKPTLHKVFTHPDTDLLDSKYVYSDVVSACVITTYYAYLIVVNTEINRLQADVSYVEENAALAQAICLSVDYCSHAGHCGTQTMNFSLPIATTALSGRYKDWAETWLGKISGDSQC